MAATKLPVYPLWSNEDPFVGLSITDSGELGSSKLETSNLNSMKVLMREN